MTTPLIVGNWKMNTSLDTALALATATAAASDAAGGSVDVGICPPYPWIVPVANAVRGASLRVGAQDCAATTDGAHTGDVSATMIAGHCTFTLIGHSERRHQHHESDDIIHAKLGLALDAGLSVILCVGETKEERDAGREHDVVNAQLRTALAGIDPDMAGRLTIAYEPVWSIGTGNAATDDDAAIMAREIRATLSELLP
ncbi:MAG TPA: triose-phosphate isomerase, partial [Thermomicrobiales bacterium]|nr:triose-phosphate isomerase [Thermomicrobiales bacterium]